jgi:hypothetical protein
MNTINTFGRQLVLFSSGCLAYNPSSKSLMQTYLGGKSKDRMKVWSYWLQRNDYTESLVFCRKSTIFLEWKYEIELTLHYPKIVELSEKYIESKKPDLYAKEWKPKVPESTLHQWQIGDKIQKGNGDGEILTLTTKPSGDGTVFVKDKNEKRNLIRLSDYQIVQGENHEEFKEHKT